MRKLTKTILWALVGMAMGYFMNMDMYGDGSWLAMGLGMAGYPAGWRLISKLNLIALGIMGFFAQILLAIPAGFVALPMEIICGIIELRKERV